MRFLYDNKIIGSTITASTENPAYLFDTAFNDRRLSRVGRTLGVTSENIVFDLGTAQSITDIAIIEHNFTSSATVVLEGNSSDSWGAPPVQETLTITDFIHKNFTGGSYRYWRITMADATNTAGFLQIAKIFLGTYLQLPHISGGLDFPYESNALVQTSPTNQVYGSVRTRTYNITVQFPSISNTEKTNIDTFFNTVDKVIPFVNLIWESDLTTQPPLYTVLTSDLQWKKNGENGLSWNLKLSFKQAG